MTSKLTKFFISLFIIFSTTTNIHSQVFWNEVTSGVTTALRCVSNVNGNIAWVCGAGGTVIKTTNGGYNWFNYTGNGIPTNVTLINIYAVDVNIALAAGYTGTTTYAYRTSNGGSNWTQVFIQNNGFINGVWMTSALEGYMVGDPVPSAGGRWSLWRTSNGGINWDSSGFRLNQTGTEAGWNSSLWVVKDGILGDEIWFGTNNSKIYHSSSSGGLWDVQSTGSEVNTYSVCIDTTINMNGLAGGANSLLKTTNGGNNWTTVTVPGSGNINGLAMSFRFLTAAWYIRSGTGIYMSYPPYTSWITQYTAPAGTYNHIAVSRQLTFGPGMIYAVRSNGGISRGNFFIEGVKILSNEIPASYKVYQNYPNPFNPVTKIKLEVPLLRNNVSGEVRGALITIRVYDAIGREVEKMLEQITQPGVYEDEWDGSKYPSGVYYYVVTISDPRYPGIAEFRETKKMVLVK